MLIANRSRSSILGMRLTTALLLAAVAATATAQTASQEQAAESIAKLGDQFSSPLEQADSLAIALAAFSLDNSVLTNQQLAPLRSVAGCQYTDSDEFAAQRSLEEFKQALIARKARFSTLLAEAYVVQLGSYDFATERFTYHGLARSVSSYDYREGARRTISRDSSFDYKPGDFAIDRPFALMMTGQLPHGGCFPFKTQVLSTVIDKQSAYLSLSMNPADAKAFSDRYPARRFLYFPRFKAESVEVRKDKVLMYMRYVDSSFCYNPEPGVCTPVPNIGTSTFSQNPLYPHSGGAVPAGNGAAASAASPISFELPGGAGKPISVQVPAGVKNALGGLFGKKKQAAEENKEPSGE